MKYFRLPRERIGVAVGPGGAVKREIERKTGTKIEIDSETGEVKVFAGDDPLGQILAINVLNAIGRGFSPDRAMQLLSGDKYLEVIDIEDAAGRSEKALVRLKGRIIGEKGKTRRIVEETTGVSVSVYGKTVALIGRPEDLATAREAISMLLSGSPHSAVYAFLERKRREAKRQVAKVWRENSEKIGDYQPLT